MKRLHFALLMLLAFMGVHAQLVTSSPMLLQRGSTGIELTYHADSSLGNLGLAGLPSSIDVYAHIGLITSKSGSQSDWKYTVTPWPNTGNQQTANVDKNRLTYVGANTYKLVIGDIKSYFGITDESETVKSIAIVFRNADATKTGRMADGSDILISVLGEGFQCALYHDAESLTLTGPTTINFTLESTMDADLSLKVNNVEFGSASSAKVLKASYTFDQEGTTYTIQGMATPKASGYYPQAQFLKVVYPRLADQIPYPGGVPKMGAVKNADGSVTFCLAAPGKNSAIIVGSWDNYQVLDSRVMNFYDYEGQRYFWITIDGLANNEYYPYYYLVDETYKVGDPYAHLVLDPYNDKYLRESVWPDRPPYPYDKITGNVLLGVYRGDMDDYKFSSFTIPEHDNLVIYELLVRDFTGYDGLANAWGTIAAAKEKIPYIKAMGFNAIELMPIMEFNGNNSWGYNTNFYMAPDKAYGSPTDYKDFVEACHREGIAVILDIVFNQSDGLHPWYQLYPIASNPFYNREAPHSWSVLNDWNQGNALVQQQWTDALKYWMTAYNVDGFRFDLVKGLGDNDSYAAGTEAYNQSRVDRMKRLHAVIKSVKANGIHINEDLAGNEEEKALGNDGQLQWANINSASCNYAKGVDSNTNFMRFYSQWDGSRPWGSTVSYAQSHDEQRVAYEAESYGQGDIPTNAANRYRRLGALAVQMLLTPGPKMVWQFEELANAQNTKSSDGGNNTSPKIVDWTSWLADPDRVYLRDTYAACINTRMTNPELFARDAEYSQMYLGGKYANPRTMRLTKGDKEVVAFINPALSGDMKVTLTSKVVTTANNRLVWASDGFTPVLGGTGNNLELTVPAGGFAIYASNAVAGISSLDADIAKAYPVAHNGNIEIAGSYTTAAVYDLSGRRCPFTGLRPGIYIVVIDSVPTKVKM